MRKMDGNNHHDILDHHHVSMKVHVLEVKT